MVRHDILFTELLARIDALTSRINCLEAENQLLRDQVQVLKKNSKNSSKPPSSDIVKPKTAKHKTQGKRSKGAQPGHKRHTREPFEADQIDQSVEYEFTLADAKGLIPLDQWHIVQQVELQLKPFEITEHRARKYLDPKTGQIHIAPLPDEILAAGLIGPRLSALIAYQKAACHMSYSTIQQFLKELLGLPVSRGQLVKVVQKASGALKGSYDQLYEALVDQDRLGIDETGHKDSGKLKWTWCFNAPMFSVFHINDSRGSQVLKTVLGETFGGIIGCDYYGAYRKYIRESNGLVQYCMAHLVREVRFLAEHSDASLSRWGQDLLGRLKKLFDTLHRRDELTAHGFRRSMNRIRVAFLEVMRDPVDHKASKRLARRFKQDQANHYFTFLTEPNVEPTNNGTEREIRQVVIDRHITQGPRSANGQDWWERIWTVLATCRKQKRSAYQYIYHALIAHWTNQPSPSLLPNSP